jgi:O-antigen ligase
MIETLTLNAQTAWWRVYIWNFGTQNVIDNPVLGLGLNDWVRPEWLTASVDNFWLLIAMRHGLPAILLLVLGLVLHLWRIIRVRDISESDNKVRIAYLIGFVSLCFVLSTVHAWGAPSVLVMFYFGMGAYLYTGGARATNEAGMVGPPELAGPDRQLRYSRFSPRSRTPENIELSANLIWQGGSGQEIRLKGNNRVSSK